MADLLVAGSISGETDQIASPFGPYWISTQIGAEFHIDSGVELIMRRTTDAGATWVETVVDASGFVVEVYAVWFDQENVSDTGTLVHVAWLDRGTQDARYKTVDLADASLGTEQTIIGSLTVADSPQTNRITLTKANNGNLLMAFKTPTEVGCYRSVDAGANWTARSDAFYEATTEDDWLLLFPANVDAGDVVGIYWDASATAISAKMYDDSADTVTETAILSSISGPSQGYIQYDGAVRHSDELILGCVWSEGDTATADLLTFTINPNSIASPTIDTTTANIITDTSEAVYCGMHINQQNDDVRVVYLIGGTFGATVDVAYKLSDDGMATWGSELAVSVDAAADHRRCHAGRTTGAVGGQFMPLWFNKGTLEIYVNLTNAVEIAAASGVVGVAGLNLGAQPIQQRWEVVAY